MEKNNLKSFKFHSKIWRSDGAGGWYFASIPRAQSQKIRSLFKSSEEGWGRLKVIAEVQEEMSWNTSIWFDTKSDVYLLPVKAQVRKKLGLTDGSSANFLLKIST